MDGQPNQVPFEPEIKPVSPIPEGTKLPSNEPVIPPVPTALLDLPKASAFSAGKLASLAGGAGLLVALVVLAVIYYPPSTQKVIAKMYSKLSAITTSEITGKIDLQVTLGTSLSELDQQVMTGAPKQIKGSLEFDTVSDISDVNNPKSSGTIKLSGEGLVLAAETRGIGKIFYFKLTEAPLLGFIDTGTFKDQWLRVESDPNNMAGIRGSNPAELMAQQKEDIRQALAEAKILNIETKLPAEKIAGVATYHFKFSIDKQNLGKFIVKVSQIMNQPMTEQQTADFNKGLESVELTNGEVWIGKKDFMPYKLLTNLSFKSEAAQSQGTMAVNLTVKDYNQAVQIETPYPSKTLQELFGNSFKMPLGIPGSNSTVLPPEPHKTN
ncbi:MAG TPA: hypothetical protein VGQ87_00485 [Patescibacteria group bacterium]|jgi:hypothetical protein|nr:hypothetical protein [Patescibacteria group bacterium]